jgi:glucose/arabinose dehydrogenase
VACSDDAARFPRAVPARASETNERRGGMTHAIKGGLAAAIAAAALTLTPPLALAEDAPVAVPQETAPAAPATSSSSSPDTPTTATPVEAAPTSPSVSVSPPSVPSGTYPLASSAPLPSELKKMEKDAAAKDAKEGNKDGTKSGGGGGDGKKQSKSARLEELNQMRLELDLKEIEVRQKTQELVKQEQTSATIQEELELARKLNGILQAELDRVKEETKLASGLCAQVGGF